ncbi:hypothetical protein NDN08_002425 [Rhodosorus marinus]|uniref:HVA22-like protein n=1 Tax=Rhodosorus marinus TaxID=101924 RepID=A0AAV8UTQ6_9RHOD|nr:hypothetical protein NDN08_002425 [Rhodosorus marinus]
MEAEPEVVQKASEQAVAGFADQAVSFFAKVSQLYDEKSGLLRDAVQATGLAFVAWWRLVGPFLILLFSLLKGGALLLLRALAPSWPYVVKGFHKTRTTSASMAAMAWPHIKESLRKMARGVAAADPRTIITVLLAVSVLLAGGYALIRLSTMRRKSRKRMSTGLRKSGALVVAYLSLLVIFFLPDQVLVDDVLPTSTLIHIPLYMNLRLLSKKADASTAESFDHWLCYWAVHAVLDLIWRFPRVGIRARGIFVFGKVRMLLGVWLGFPIFGGAELIIDALAPLIDKNFKRMPKNNLNKATSWILSMLQFGNVVTPEKASEIKLALSDPGFVVAFAAVFLITPEIITRGACLFVELVSPIYASMYSYINEDISLKTKWLQFWVVSRLMLLILDQVRDLTSYIPLWTRLELLVSIWLQIPYFNGASRVYKELDTLFAKGRELANRIGILKKAKTVDNENNKATEVNDADEVAQVSDERKNQ